MFFRFSKVDYNDDYKDYDYKNAYYLCCLDKENYAEYINFLHFMKHADEKENRNYGKINVVYEDANRNKVEDVYSIADINYDISPDDAYLECVEVYLYEK